MATTHVQGAVGTIGSGTSGAVSLASPPTNGNLVCVGFITVGTVTGLSIKDNNGNVYTVTPNSPEGGGALGAFTVWLAYWHAAGAGANAPHQTLNFFWTGTASATIWMDEFSHSGNCKFDSDVGANQGAVGGNTAINTPTITPSLAGSLLYSTCGCGHTCTSPTAGGTQGAWTGAGGAITNGNMAEYILSQAASNRAVDYVQNLSGGWLGMVMSFLIDQPGHIQLEGGTGNVELENLSGDIALET